MDFLVVFIRRPIAGMITTGCRSLYFIKVLFRFILIKKTVFFMSFAVSFSTQVYSARQEASSRRPIAV